MDFMCRSDRGSLRNETCQSELECRRQENPMKVIKLPFLALAALLTLSACSFAQQKPGQPTSGASAQGLASGQARPMTLAIAKQLVAAAVKASCSPPAGACSGAFAIVDDA